MNRAVRINPGLIAIAASIRPPDQELELELIS